jgi:hypothetical protein
MPSGIEESDKVESSGAEALRMLNSVEPIRGRYSDGFSISR